MATLFIGTNYLNAQLPHISFNDDDETNKCNTNRAKTTETYETSWDKTKNSQSKMIKRKTC